MPSAHVRAWLQPVSASVIVVTAAGFMGLMSGCDSDRSDGALPRDLRAIPKAVHAPLTGLAPGSDDAQRRQREAVSMLDLPLEVKTRKTGIVLRLIPAGRFAMGSPVNERGSKADERLHPVELTQPFYCGKFEVTRRQWAKVMGKKREKIPRGWNVVHVSVNMGKDTPIVNVTWKECQTFLEKLCRLEGVASGTYRLLTEAEWEYACRAGTTSRFCSGERDSDLPDYGWYRGNSGGKPRPVGKKRPNAFGLYDTHGNVNELCQDRYGEYPKSTVIDPNGPPSEVEGVYMRVSRGGGWFSEAKGCRSAARLEDIPSAGHYAVGLRVARTAPSVPVD